LVLFSPTTILGRPTTIEATNISRARPGYPFTREIYDDAHVAAWRRVTKAVHEAGGKIVCQLWPVGRMSHTDLQENVAGGPFCRGAHFPRVSQPAKAIDAVASR